MTIDLKDHTDGVELGTSLYASTYADYGHNTNFGSVRLPENSYFHDPLLADLQRIEFRYTRFPIFGNFGNVDESPSIEKDSTLVGFPPSPSDLPTKLDRLNSIDAVFRFLSGDANDLLVSNEHTTAHVNLTGEVHVGSVPALQVGGPDGNFFWHVYLTGSPPSSFEFDIPLPSWATRPIWNEDFGVGTIKERLLAGYYSYTVSPGIDCSVKDFVTHHSEGHLVGVAYTVVNDGWGSPGDGISGYLAHKEIRIGIGFSWHTFNSEPTTSAYFFERISPGFKKRVRTIKAYDRAYGQPIVWYLASSFGANPNSWTSDVLFMEDGSWGCWTCSTPPRRGWEQYSGITGPLGYRKIDTGPTSFLRFRRDVHQISNDLLAVGFLAQCDAFDTSFTVLKSNLLETLLEMGDVFSLISNPVALIKRIRKFPETDKIHGVKLMLDFLSDATLYYSFMLNPTIELADEMSAKAERLSRSFNQFFGFKTIMGKASYEIGDELNGSFSGCVVVAHSKMRVRVPPDIVWSAVMPLEAMHLLPDLSTYWETLRLSFVVDWFFNVQSKLDVVDHTIKFMALDTGNCVNSVTLYKPILPTGFSVGDETSYKYYCRYVLTAPQVFTPTALNVLGAQGIPNWLVAGSLFYKLS